MKTSSKNDDPGRGRRPGRWLAGRTLRGRLIAGVLALLFLACATVGLVTYFTLREHLVNQLDNQLAAASRQYTQCEEGPEAGKQSEPPEGPSGESPQSESGPFSCDSLPGQARGTFSATVQGSSVQSATITPQKIYPLSDTDRLALTAAHSDHSPWTYTLSSAGTYRLLAYGGPAKTVYITGLPMANMNSTLREVALTEVIVFSAALLLTGFLGTGFVRLSLRPLRRVAATATRVTQLPLGSGEVSMPERVPDADPRTEVGQVGAAFNRMLGHVEAALGRRAASEARLRRFAADASHELRTPLAAIRGYAELARRHPGPVPADIAHALSRVESESARMSVLVDELLLLAQLDAGRPLAREPVDLSLLAINAASDAHAATPDHRWQLELPDEPVMVRGDEHRLRQVLANLLSNAGSHTPPGTTVTVALAAADASTANVRLSVTDNGPGIPEDLQPGLFERFVRGDTSRSHTAGSTGLGLAIVDAVASAHGGSASVSSEPGRTQFMVTLPQLTGADEPAEADSARPPTA